MFVIVLGVPLLIVAIVLIVAAALRWAKPPTAIDPEIAALLKSARRRIVVALLAGVAAIAVLTAIDRANPDLLGIPLTLAPALGGVAGLLVYAALPPRVPTVPGDAVRVASLTPRTPWTFLPRRMLVVALIVTVVQTGVLLFTGASSSRDDLGHNRAFTVVYALQEGVIESRNSPYAGWFYAVPLLIVTLILALATLVAVWRVSVTPAVPKPEFTSVDAEWRRATNRIMVGMATALVAVQLQGVALVSGAAMVSAVTNNIGPGTTFSPGWLAAGRTLEVIGFAAWVTSMVLVVKSLWAVADLPGRVVARAASVPGSASALVEEGSACSS